MPTLVKQLFSDPKLDWLSACQSLEEEGKAYCIITIVAQTGSLPRGTGSKMIVSRSEQFDTLGGGGLEFEVISKAREGLVERQSNGNASPIDIERFGLAADFGQCCGGATQVMFEYINTALPRIVIFGAGHVCQALTSIIKELPCHLVVIDSRESWLKKVAQQGVSTLLNEKPSDVIASLSKQSNIVIMTHEHSLDFEIARVAMERQCFPFIGLIGSKSKQKSFVVRFKEQLTNISLLDQLTCPVGDLSIKGKLPMQVAVSISVQLMALFEAQNPRQIANNKTNEKQWSNTNDLRRDLKEINNNSILKSS